MTATLFFSGFAAAALTTILRALRLSDAPFRPIVMTLGLGAVTGLAIVVTTLGAQPAVAAVGCAAVLAASLLRDDGILRVEGALAGFATASFVAVAVLLDGSAPGMPIVAALITGTVAALAWLAVDHPAGRVLLSAGVIAAAFFTTPLLDALSPDPSLVAPAIAGGIGVVGLAAFAIRLAALRPLLLEEAEWGIVDSDLVRHLTSTWKRMFRPVGFDRQMWREISRTAHRLAERRARQRRMTPETARVQQIEIVRLRTRLLDLRRMQSENSRPSPLPPIE